MSLCCKFYYHVNKICSCIKAEYENTNEKYPYALEHELYIGKTHWCMDNDRKGHIDNQYDHVNRKRIHLSDGKEQNCSSRS